MDLSSPHRAVTPSLHGEVLVALARAAEGLSGRELARRAGSSQEGARTVLLDLVQQGIVEWGDAPPARLYRLNSDHVAAPAVAILADLRQEVFRRLEGEIGSWSPAPLNVTVFGSAARGDGSAESDFDILVVRPDDVDPDSNRWHEELGELARLVRAWTGNDPQVLEYSFGEALAAVHERVPVLRDILDEGVRVYGDTLTELTRPARLGR